MLIEQRKERRVLKRGCLYCNNAKDGQVGNFYIECWCPFDGGYVISMDEAVIDASELEVCPHFRTRRRQDG